LRTRASASASLSRTPASAGNRKTWTWSGWVKRGILGVEDRSIFNAYSSLSSYGTFAFRYAATPGYDTLEYIDSNSNYITTTQVFRDIAGWYHFVLAFDTTQATAANRIKLYVNGVQVTAFSRTSYPTQNTDSPINQAVQHNFAYWPYTPTYLDAYLAEVNFIDGQALTPSSFGSTNALTGVWQPARYTGTYGTNGFYLPFTDNSALTTSSNVGLGRDYSGNGNYWTTNNISITAGVTYDSMTDVPTLTSATASNYCVMNPLRNSNTTITAANLNVASPSNTCGATGTFAVNTGKWYWEVNCISNGIITANGVPHIGIIASDESSLVGSATNMYLYRANGDLYTGAGYGQTGLATYTNNDVIGVAYDAGANSLQFYKNNTVVGTPISTTANKLYQPYWLVSYVSVNSSAAYNFGQRPFTYTPPTGFVALNTFNLPTSTIVKGNTVMDATLYTGNGAASQVITNAAGFRPDFVWGKPRSGADQHWLTDAVRGVGSQLNSNSSGIEITNQTTTLLSLNSNGYTVGASTNLNRSGFTFVGWQWQAGQGSTSSNTNGSITSTVSVNASAGFSVVTYTGTNTGTPSPMPTVGHGLGVAPSLVISKSRNLAGVDSGAWFVWTSAQATDNYLRLNTTAASASISGGGGGTMVAPTSSVFSTPYLSGSNINANNYVAYCWTPIAGFSAFGSYTGNGSSDGTFVYLGFRPKFLLIKSTAVSGNWWMYDTARSTYNLASVFLYANASDAEVSDTANGLDMLSNGFKLRVVGNFQPNTNGSTFIYAAFAENPFKNALAR
jgi:hypothetical protein